MSLHRSTLVGAFVSALVFVTSPSSAASDDRTGGDRTGGTRQDDTRRRPLALTVNPLGLVIQRYGGNVEWSPVRHQAIVASGYVQSVPVELVRPFASGIEIRDRATAPSFGGEIGWRLYSGRKGADGLFIGGAFVAMPMAYPRLGPDLAVELERIYGIGGAVDVGAQTVTDFGLTIGGGIGASFLAYDFPDDVRRLPVSLPGVLPRLLLQTGYAF